MYTHLLVKLRHRSKEQPASKRTVHQPLFPDYFLIKAIQEESDCQRSPLAGVISQLRRRRAGHSIRKFRGHHPRSNAIHRFAAMVVPVGVLHSLEARRLLPSACKITVWYGIRYKVCICYVFLFCYCCCCFCCCCFVH